MDDLKHKTKKCRDRGKLQDVMRKETFSHSLDDVLNVKKAPIVEKHNSFGATSRVSINQDKSAEGSSSNESFLSASSHNFSSDLHFLPSSFTGIQNERLNVPSINRLPSKEHLIPKNVESESTVNVDTTDMSLINLLENSISINEETSNVHFDMDFEETLPSFDEEIFEINTRILKNDLNDQNISAKEEDTELKSDNGNESEYIKLFSSAASSQAFLETLADDSSVQIEALIKSRDEEMTLNKSLRSRVVELENLKTNMDGFVADLEISYQESYSELTNTYHKELEFIKMESKVEATAMKDQIKDLSGKLLIAESQNVAKDELVNDLNTKIQDLETSLEQQEIHCQEELQGVIAKVMKNESITLAKNEVEDESFNETENNNIETLSNQKGDIFVNNVSTFIADIVCIAENEIELEANRNLLEDINFDRASMVADLRRASLQLGCYIEDVSPSLKTKRCKISSLSKSINQSEISEGSLIESSTFRLNKSRLIQESKQENEQLKKDLELINEKNKELEKDAIIKNELLVEREKWILDSQALSNLNNLVQVLEMSKADLESRVTDMKEKIVQLESEKNSSLLKRVSLDSLLVKVQKENEILVSKNNALQLIAENSINVKEKCASLETELENLKESSGYGNMEQELSSVRKEFNELRGSLRLTNPSILERTGLNYTDATQYMEYISAPPVTTATQTDTIYTESAVQTDFQPTTFDEQSDTSQYAAVRGFTAEEFCPTCRPRSGRRSSLDVDLQVSWTERCEVEQQLAGALAKNEILQKYKTQLEKIGLHASSLVDAGVPSAAIWLQLRSCIKDIDNDLSELRNTKVEVDGRTYYLIPKTDSKNPFDTPPLQKHTVSNNLVGERSSPEGGRESPKLTDGQLESTFEEDSDHVSNEDAVDNRDSQDLVLDKPAEDALFEMVQDLLRCLGNDEINCSVNSTLSASLCEKMATLTDAGELCRCWQQVKDEVARISALSSKVDPTVKLQEEVRSLEHQVIASDKQVRLTRSFLEEQAAEREVERDESAQRINELTELVRTKDRQLAAKHHLSQDVEAMAQQLSDVQAALEFENKKRATLEFSLEQNSQKVATLREIIDTLEIQLAECSEQLQTAREDNIKLQKQLIQNSHQSLEREDAQRDSYSDTLVYVARLEEELTSLQHRINATGPESIAFARVAIRDLEAVVARRTRQLEIVQVPWNAALSSASEELSTRDHADITRCVTPDEMAVEPSVGLCEDVERLKERILKHARVEEAALKKMKELEVASAKRDELQFDLEAAMLRIDDLLCENGSVKARLEKERSRPQDQFVAADLEMKVRSLENELERVTEELQAEKKLVLEKVRREERLQDSLESREIEILEETKAFKEAQEKLKQEKSQRLALESRIHELNKIFEEKNEIIGELRCLVESQSREISNSSQFNEKKLDDIQSTSENKILELSDLCEQKDKELHVLRAQSEERLLEMSALCEQKDKQIEELRNATELHLQELSSLSDSDSKKGSTERDLNEIENLPHLNVSSLKRHVATSKNSSTSSSSSKKVRFCNPESFVGSSLTPISRNSPSVLRDHHTVDEQWGDLEHIPRKPMAWESISSVAALHLSPRGAHINNASETFYSPIPNNSSSQLPLNENFPDLKNRLKNEMALLESKLTTTTQLLELSEGKFDKEVQKLENELAKCKEKASFDCKEIENARKISEESLNQLRVQFENCQSLITVQKSTIKSLENQLKSSKTSEENEKQKGLIIIADLQFQVESVTTELKKQQKEVLIMKSILKETVDELSRVRSARDEIALSEKHLSNELVELEKQKRVNSNLNNQIKVLNVKVQELTQNNNNTLELDQKNKELKLVKQALSAKNEEIAGFRKEIAAKLEVFEKDSNKLSQMEQVIKEYEETINKVVNERDHLKFDNIKLTAVMETMQRERTLAQQRSDEESDNKESSEKLFIDAASKVSDLRTCLEQNLSRSASLEANLVFVQTQLASSESKAASLQAQLLLATRQVDELTKQLQRANNSQSNHTQQVLDTSRIHTDHIAAQLETVQNQLMHYQRKEGRQVKKLQEELMASKSVENELRNALKTHFELEKDMINREATLKDKLKEAEKELLRIQFASDLKDVNVRGLEKLHHHTLALRTRQPQILSSGAVSRDLRSVRSAGDGEDRPCDMQWTIQRLESYRKQLVWQKRFLQDSRVFPRRNGRRSLRVVVLAVIAIHRMHFLVRRWKHAFKLPPLVSPPRREKDGLLMLTSPPCRETNHRINQIN